MTFTCEPFILPNLTSSQKSIRYSFFSERLGGIRMFSLEKLTWSVAVSIWAPQRPENIIGNEKWSLGIHDANFQKQFGQRHQERTTASDCAAISKTENCSTRNFTDLWIFSGRCFSNSDTCCSPITVRLAPKSTIPYGP